VVVEDPVEVNERVCDDIAPECHWEIWSCWRFEDPRFGVRGVVGEVLDCLQCFSEVGRERGVDSNLELHAVVNRSPLPRAISLCIINAASDRGTSWRILWLLFVLPWSRVRSGPMSCLLCSGSFAIGVIEHPDVGSKSVVSLASVVPLYLVPEGINSLDELSNDLSLLLASLRIVPDGGETSDCKSVRNGIGWNPDWCISTWLLSVKGLGSVSSDLCHRV
jgi:hypothetical protein